MSSNTPWLNRLQAQYFALYPPRHIQWPEAASLALARHQAQLYAALIADPQLAAFPPARDYQRKFWKQVVARLEEELASDQAVAEELVSNFSN